MNQLPNEILTIILGLCIHDYFSCHRHLSSQPPAPLHVCRKWRQLAISTPACWSNIKVHINTQSKMKYACRNVSRRDTKSKAMQDTLNHYFRWAKDCPVDLSIDFSHHFGNRVKTALIHWIGSNMPKLRSYRDEGNIGLFYNILPTLSVDCFSELTELQIASPGYGFKTVHSVPMPKLRILRLISHPEIHHNFIGHLDSPNLRALYMGIDNPRLIQVVTALERFPLLVELAIHVYFSWKLFGPETAVPRPEFGRLRRIIIVGGCQRTTLFISNCRSLFSRVRDWTIDSSFAKTLSGFPFTEDLAMSGVETLSVLCHTRPYTPCSETESNKLWNFFPNIVHLTIGAATYRRRFKFSIESDIGDTVSAEMECVIEGLFESLGLKSEDGISPRHCPELKTIEVLDSNLSMEALGFLLDILRLRSSSTLDATNLRNEDKGCRLTVKSSRYFYTDEDSVSLETWNASYSEFEILVDNLRAETHLNGSISCHAVAS